MGKRELVALLCLSSWCQINRHLSDEQIPQGTRFNHFFSPFFSSRSITIGQYKQQCAEGIMILEVQYRGKWRESHLSNEAVYQEDIQWPQES